MANPIRLANWDRSNDTKGCRRAGRGSFKAFKDRERVGMNQNSANASWRADARQVDEMGVAVKRMPRQHRAPLQPLILILIRRCCRWNGGLVA